jgi:putative hydrolase of the HAD superfamily
VEIRGVLLDLDGTLIDQEGATEAALRAWLPAYGVPVTAAVVTAWTEIQERHLADWRERRIGFQQQRRNRVRDFLPLIGVACPDDPAALDRIFGGYLRHYEDSWRVFDDVEDMLTALAGAGLATAVLTNGTTEQQNQKLARVGLAGRVGPVYTVEDLGVAKPHAGAFLGACERWGLAPGAVLSVGDRYDLDVLAARAAGLHAVHLDRHGPGPEAIASLRELGTVIAGRRPGRGE